MFGIDITILAFIALAGCSAGAVAYAFLFNRIASENTAGRRLQTVKNAETDRSVVKASRDRVVEAAKRSGSLITARLALEQNRDVFAVPGFPLDPRAEGGNALIQQGAKLITSAADIIETLGSADPSRSALFDRDWEPDPAPDAPPPSADDKSRLLAALGPTPIEVDELVRQSGLSAASMQMLLLELDLAGQIEWSSGQLVALRY